jgi:rubrerythrin
MKNKKLTRTKSTIVALLSVALVVPLAAHAAGQVSKTLQNLQSAYNGESNAHAKYLEFAKQAEKEGYGRIGSLFRAAAAAEQIHRICEANVIKEMGASPEAKIKLAPIKSTKQNLEESANKGEAYERDTMYPSFIRQAHKDRSQAAAQCFQWAQAAEAEHFKLFKDAAENLAQMRGGPQAYYVCREGGYTMAKLDAAKCPGGKYEEVR